METDDIIPINHKRFMNFLSPNMVLCDNNAFHIPHWF